jgi:hypothetical protein
MDDRAGVAVAQAKGVVVSGTLRNVSMTLRHPAA